MSIGMSPFSKEEWGKIMRRVGEVSYELELPEGSKIHNVFHVSCLKKEVGQFISTPKEIPPLDEEG
jgi:hypothetical protein